MARGIRGVPRTEPPTESQDQQAVVAWAARLVAAGHAPDLALLYAIPNAGGFRGSFRKNVVQVMRAKREGVRPGVPDLHLPVTRHGALTLYIELKRAAGPGERPGVVSDDQRWWHERLTRAGHAVRVSYGRQDAMEVLCWYLGLSEALCSH